MFGFIFNKNKPNDEASALAIIIKKNRQNLNIDKNGFVSLNLKSQSTLDALDKEFGKLKEVKVTA